MKNKNRLTLDEKIDEAYELCIKGIIPRTVDDICFSDGIKVGNWLSRYQYYLKNISKKNDKAKVIYEKREASLAQRSIEEYNKVLVEVYNLLIIHPDLLKNDSSITLSSGRQVFQWMRYNRKRLYLLSQKGNEDALNLVNVVEQIDPKYFEVVDAVKNRERQKLMGL